MQQSDLGPDRIFPPATGLISARRNLLSHLLRLADMRLASGPTSGGAWDPFGQGDAFLDALQHISELLDPSFRPSVLTTADSMRAALTRLEALWTEIVIAEADPLSAQKACDYSHKLLTRLPMATACYVNECATSFAEPQMALDLLAYASRFISNHEERAQVGRAQDYALEVLLKHKILPVPPPPAESDLPAAVARPQRTETTLEPATPAMIPAAGHKAALERITEMGELFFERPANTTHLTLRASVLVIGPTGAGKTFLAKQAARQLRAEYFRVTRGDWIPQGARTKTRPTTFQILDRLLASERLAIHCDEIEKMDIDFSKEWSAGIGSDLWNTLEGIFPIREYLADTKFGDRPVPTVEEVERKIRTSMWVIGSGAWQAVFEQNGKTISFNPNQDGGGGDVTVESIRKAALISPEILLRFNSDIVFLPYPGRHETAALLVSTGIAALAAELGITIADGDVNWNQGGMRILETIATRLALEKLRRSKRKGVSLRP